MKKLRENPPTGFDFGGYVHRNMTGTANGFSHSGKTTMTRNATYAQQVLRLRPSNDLHLDVLGLPNAGLPHQPTVPRQRPQTQQLHSRGHPFAKSDAYAVGALRTSTRAGARSNRHERAKTVDDRLLPPSSITSEDFVKNPRKLEPLQRPPSSQLRVAREPSARRIPFGTLPPIEGESVPLSRTEDPESSTGSSSESEDEVARNVNP